jgi:RNA polymerase sigma-70 factor, ECF subfamily
MKRPLNSAKLMTPELVARPRSRDEAAFREIVESYACKIYRVSYGILGNRDDANDVAQEVFAKVFSSIHGFAGRSSLYAWIYRITVNECYDFLRKKRLKTTYSSDSIDDAQVPRMEIADWRPTPDRPAIRRDFINKLLADIPKDDRWLLIAKEVEGFSIAELSQITGLKENTIKDKLFRAREALATAHCAMNAASVNVARKLESLCKRDLVNVNRASAQPPATDVRIDDSSDEKRCSTDGRMYKTFTH